MLRYHWEGKGTADVGVRSDLSDSDLEYSQLFSDPATCGMELEMPRIIGGAVTELYEFPWVVALEYKSNYNKENLGIGCGGSLINKNYVLTAAHCVFHFDLVLIGVWLGDWNITSHPRDCRIENTTCAKECNDEVLKIGVKDKIIHPFFSRNPFKDDIALVQLEQEVQYTDYIRPICLPAANQQLPPFGTLLTVAGWGTTNYGIWSTTDVKMKVDLPLVRNDQCATKRLTITENDFCAGGEAGKDSCWGDSGGPIMRRSHHGIVPQWYLEGVVSHGHGCGNVGYPAVYVHVSKYMHWIKNVLKYNKKFAPCTTPNNETAYCIPLSMCTVISDGVKKGVPSAIEFAEKSHCGSILILEPHVCCGSTGKDVADFGVQANCVPDSDNSQLSPNFTTCGMERERPKIIGGSVTELYEFPWVVALEYKWIRDNSKLGIRCGGSLINKNYVLTSAVCVTNNYIEVISVWLGDWNITSHPRDCRTEDTTGVTECNDEVLKIGVKDKIRHPFFSRRTLKHNIALVRLEEEVQYTDYILPICLPAANQKLPPFGNVLTVVGWGTTENGTGSDVKRKVQLPLVTNDKCASKNLTITENDLCAGGEGGKDSCRGDSGGPIMSYSNRRNQPQWYLEGMVSQGYDCAKAGYPAVYTHVSKYINWIDNVMKYHEEFAPCITPDNEPAYCIPVSKCKTIYDGVTKGVSSVIEFTKKFQCGSIVDPEPYICCGSAGETTKVALPSPIPKTSEISESTILFPDDRK